MPTVWAKADVYCVIKRWILRAEEERQFPSFLQALSKHRIKTR
jgi:hypothetical protein